MTDDPSRTQNLLVEALLVRLARDHAPRVAPAGWQRPGDLDRPLPRLARQLADEGVLVILGDRSGTPSEAVPPLVAECVTAYKVLYELLTRRLFPSFKGIKPYYHSYSHRLLAIFFVAEAPPVTQALAGYVAPYAAQRPAGVYAPARDVIRLMDAVLQPLEPGALAPSQYENLRRNGAAVIQWMLSRPLQQVPLLPFDRPLFAPLPPLPTTLPGIRVENETVPAHSASHDENTTELIPGVEAPPSDADDDSTTLPPMPGLPPDAPPAPVPYRPRDRRPGTGTT
jgi:hypothetical protein